MSLKRSGFLVVPVLLAASTVHAASTMDELLDRKRYDFQAGFGYTEETGEDSPSGSIGFQAGFTYDCHVTPFDYGVSAGYYDLGNADGPGNVNFSVIPIFAQALYTFESTNPLKFFAAAGLGPYVDRVTGDFDSDHTYLGINGALGVYSVHGLGRLGYALEGRYHAIFQPGDDDNRYLSVVASLYID